MSMKLIILGLLMEKDAHPYELKQTMSERHLDHLIKLQKGSLYYAIDKLHKDKMIDVVEVITDTNRPDRTVYRINRAGKEHFYDLLYKMLSTNERNYHPLSIGLSFSLYGDQEKIIDIFQKRKKLVISRYNELNEVYKQYHKFIPRPVIHLIKGTLEQMDIEIRMLENLIMDAQNGNLQTFGE
ncbi:PadR family transcriptional regulator [Bacillus carboniphilus]|uniref:PadR family transcriptional regulator n=1 Tax=Bacillus carboniphilus TaxID=86663 RepID=A0ABY9JUX1_9BACI|nr:PadR family transcriptional regulator [Bacillus carboniphilus]WLR43182.1 PadR family transcriptional regulator [Bacillus carboniphilus]